MLIFYIVEKKIPRWRWNFEFNMRKKKPEEVIGMDASAVKIPGDPSSAIGNDVVVLFERCWLSWLLGSPETSWLFFPVWAKWTKDDNESWKDRLLDVGREEEQKRVLHFDMRPGQRRPEWQWRPAKTGWRLVVKYIKQRGNGTVVKPPPLALFIAKRAGPAATSGQESCLPF